MNKDYTWKVARSYLNPSKEIIHQLPFRFGQKEDYCKVEMMEGVQDGIGIFVFWQSGGFRVILLNMTNKRIGIKGLIVKCHLIDTNESSLPDRYSHWDPDTGKMAWIER